jgi:hypothetical protein
MVVSLCTLGSWYVRKLEICWLALALLHLDHGHLITTLHLWLKPSFSFLFFMFILVSEDDMAWMDMGYGTMNEWG